LRYIPYIKYVLAKDTRFERDSKIFFDPDGEVAKGSPLINYGWGPSGFKELIEAFYVSKHGNKKGFNKYYEKYIKPCKGDIIPQLRADGLIREKLPAFIRMELKENVIIPALLVNVDRIYFKRCDDCDQSFNKSGFPRDLGECLSRLNLLRAFEQTFQCTRQICECLCDNYKNCILSYTSTEGDLKVEGKKIMCLIELFEQLTNVSLKISKYECMPKPGLTLKNISNYIGRSRNRKKCIERQLRFDFRPLRNYFFDPKTWNQMEKMRYHRGMRHNFDALPIQVLPNLLREEYLDSTKLVAPLNREGVLECFLKISDVKFEIYHTLSKSCPRCNLTHQITNLPIKAMFRDQDVYMHEAGFSELLWETLWKKYPQEFCESFEKSPSIPIGKSPVLKRNLKVQEVQLSSPFGLHDYDFAIDMSRLLGRAGQLILFDLTTGLWKKSGLHEGSRTPQQYLEMWKEMLFRIPSKMLNVVATWYIVVNSTEGAFFDETSPDGTTNMDELIEKVVSGNQHLVKVLKSPADIFSLDPDVHKLVVVPIFNTTQRKGEARTELRRLERKRFDQLLITQIVDLLIGQ